ncbi:replicative DNA helicase [Aquamicrobium defluvii]|uniref:DNA 5'-3' helicase n=1 Tax=Aquamicrobium defluvii TaxID=69279 RepID=A0A4R6Y0Q2_9HYPH|nr:DnaB-like helicase C-terminal domain-containing protein [Aquamicrobium defluvii]TDR28922.1 replicative DNA helicase [Aquamicrobium defluvii]
MTDQSPITGYVPELEQIVLGALLFGGDYRKVMSFLREDHFVHDLHRILYRAIVTANERFGSATVPSVAKLLPDDTATVFSSKTGKSPAAYMASLSDFNVAGNHSLDRAALAVVEQWARLKAGELAASMHAAANDPNSDPRKLIQSLSADLDLVSAEMRSGPRRKTRMSLASAAGNAFASAREAAQRGRGLTGITWGLSDVNRLTGGMQRRDLTLIGARPSAGKTTVALSTAIKAAKAGAGVGFISLEMDADKLAARAASDIAYDWHVKVPYADIIRGQASDDDLAALESATKDLDRLPILIEEQSGLSITDIRVKAEMMMDEFAKSNQSLDVLMIDHLGLIRASSRYSGNRVHEISEMTAALKSLAREYGIAVVLLSQLNRAVESRDNKRPQLSDLRDSGSIEQDADTIIFLYRESYYLEREKASGEREQERTQRLIDCQNTLEFIISKQRNGPLETVELFADMACGAIRNGARM